MLDVVDTAITLFHHYIFYQSTTFVSKYHMNPINMYYYISIKIKRENVVYIPNGIVFSLKKEANSATICNNTKEPGRHYVE